MKTGGSPEFPRPRTWLVILGALLLITCVGAPIGLTILIWEVVRVRRQIKRHKDALNRRADVLFQNISKGLEGCMDIVSRGPKERPPSVQVAPNIRAGSLRDSIEMTTNILSDSERVVAIWEPEDATKSSPRILVTNLRTWVYSERERPASEVRVFDTPNSQIRSVMAIKLGNSQSLWINDPEVLTVEAKYGEAIWSMAAWIRAAVGHTMSDSMRCPGCRSDDVYCVAEPKAASNLPLAAVLGGIAGVVGVAFGDDLVDQMERTDWRRYLSKRLVATCRSCGESWRLGSYA